ncbi:jg16039 [Pararge aegeria aegeria]|uniref:Jg16039 protein n=1 Tax=Pararge aegeria aegeria TaxID=348720 RepID=A0A8S4SPX9_9NEOP|nr:jg16039 [Pararge aegeria aegeria]
MIVAGRRCFVRMIVHYGGGDVAIGVEPARDSYGNKAICMLILDERTLPQEKQKPHATHFTLLNDDDAVVILTLERLSGLVGG